jgi:hypothetical protein
VSSYYYAKKREAGPAAREIRDAMLKEKIMEVWKGVHSRGLSVTRRRSVVVELLVQVEHDCGSCLMSLG